MSLLEKLVAERIASRIWQRDTSVFAPAPAPPAVQDIVRNRLGWLDAPSAMARHLTDLRSLAEGVRRDGIDRVCLLGMGGSSLCAEVLRETTPPGLGESSLLVLDTTDELAVNHAAAALSPQETLFIVASKSGSTIEVASLEHFFGSVTTRAIGASAGRHFVAITDPGTSLVAHAADHGYRQVFTNPADIGGRYSALSLFGLVPAALVGLNVERLLEAGRNMTQRCQLDEVTNPGLALGTFMAEQAAAGRDKLTILLPPSLAPLGQWIEQLIAESTGKDGRGILPVVDEPFGSAADYGRDRAFVVALAPDSRECASTADALAAAGHPVFRFEATADALGAEFFRWEFATAVAGAAIGVNPFDEPNVRDAKARTQALLDSYRATGALRLDPPLKPLEEIDGCLMREHRTTARQSGVREGRYIAILDYWPTDEARSAAVAHARARLRQETGCATSHGFGPRYLHSTGQYHKGGPNTGLFVLLTAADRTTTAVPGTDYSFSVLKQAQALGDFEALVAAGRDVVHFHVDNPATDFSGALERVAEIAIR
jgi:glucose-6-phosphate isomerase